MRGSRCCGFALVAAAATMTACGSDALHDIVPLPERASLRGNPYRLGPASAISIEAGSDARARSVAELWLEPLRAGTGYALPIDPAGEIRLRVEGRGEPESYRLRVAASGIRVVGSDHAGLFYGLQTLAQLMPPGVADGSVTPAGPVEVRAADVFDSPRFPYRGMHLDVGRHFFGPEFVKRYIDSLARYKLNRFHWHLTEDQGWRIEIERYPLLTEVGAYRAQTHIGHGDEPFNGDGVRYGGYYTRSEIRDVVRYAEDRFVTIVPEIDLPGHSLAAIASYPHLACTDGPFEVGMTWGVFEDIYCPKEETFEFLEGVLTEVLELFPGEYIHVGGDEVPKTRWEQSEVAQQVMAREGLADEAELQSWFLRRVESFLNANGRRLIGWDDILEGGLTPDATVMSYRGTVGGVDAARLGHDVIMTPYSHLYFDFYQSRQRGAEPLAIGGFLPLDTVYAYEPVPEELAPLEATHVLGAQGNVWTEYMKTEEHVEYMVFPRLFALAEVLWSPAESRDFPDFRRRLGWHLGRLGALGVSYRPLDPELPGL